jgi:predicted ATPase
VTALPTGTVTLLFTDVEGSTLLVRELGERYADLLAEHRHAIREACARHGGVEVDTQGDSFFFAFARASDAVRAASDAQDALAHGRLRVRICLHTGEPVVTREGYVGLDVARGARICAIGHGGQVLLSQTTRDLIDDDVRDLGRHRLKDLPAPERIFQLGRAEFPPLSSLNQTNLSLQATTLIGRRSELAELRAQLNEKNVRLLTLVGPPGAGKTRLALELAAECVEDFRDGVFVVALAPISDPELVEPTIAETLGAKYELAEYLRDRVVLLLLDNFEQVAGAAPRVSELLAAAPAVKVVVTSREPLRLAAERRFPVRPLPEADAVALFTDRARDVTPGFEPDDTVPDICRRLDHLPLAIELAAARTNVLSPAALLERLGRRMPLLIRAPRDAPDRQQTLRATIEWSYDLLGPHEQQLFARLAVFVGGSTLEAAEEVCEAELDTLAALADKSLIAAAEDRFSMLETIREYALERLTDDERAEIARRHATWLRRLAEAAVPHVYTSQGQTWIGKLRPELENLRAAVAWALEFAEPEFTLRLILASWDFGATYRDLDRWYAMALSAPDLGRSRIVADGLRDAGAVALTTEEPAKAAALAGRSLEICRELGDEEGETRALRRLGDSANLAGDPARAAVLYDQSLSIATRRNDVPGMYKALLSLGRLKRFDGERGRAADLLERSAALARSSDDLAAGAPALYELGELALDEGALAVAQERYLESLSMARRIANEPQIGHCLAGLAAVAVLSKRMRHAGGLWGALDALEAWWGKVVIGRARLRYEDILGASTAETSEAFEEGVRAGRALTLDEAVELALTTVD